MKLCPACGEENPARAKFCLECAAPLPEIGAPARETRKTVTVLFSDVTGSTALGEQLDPESLRRVMGRYFDEMQAVIERHGGTVEKFIGDAVMAVFGIPVLHEDDALRAVRAAAEMRDGLARLNEELRGERAVEIAVRTGVNTGEVVAGDAASGQRFATGDAVNVAARLEQAAAPGEILLGETTYRLVRDAVEVEAVEPLALKGKADAVAAYRLVAVHADAPGRTRRLDSPLVGRDGERRLLFGAFERTLAERQCHLFTLLGAAGVGKSRLAAEFLDGLGTQAQVLRGRCLSYGEGITYWPLAEALHDAAGGDDAGGADEAQRLSALVAEEDDGELITRRVAGVLGLAEGVASAEEGFWAVRRLLETLARRQPLVVVFDDIHWAEPSFLDLVEHVADWSRDAPILLLCVARPELLDARRGWGGDKFNATSVLLEPLGEGEAEALVENLLGPVPDEVRARIVEAAEGNPLFVEELVGMLVDDGLLQAGEDGWTLAGNASQLAVPPTIQALLAARLDRLDPTERTAAEAGAVEGKAFHRGAVAELVRADVSPALMALVRRDLVRPDIATLPGEDAFRFRHQLIRDAAYDALPKEARADLHERFAEWLEQHGGEHDEILGYHLEQAVRYRRELAPGDPRGGELAGAASLRLAAAGRSALGRGDFAAAAGLLRRAVDLTATGVPERAKLLYELGRALERQGEFLPAATALEEARKLAKGAGDRSLELRASIHHSIALARIDPTWDSTDLRAASEEGIRVFAEKGDELGLVQAYRGLSEVHLELCRWEASATALEHAVLHARAAGDALETAQSLSLLANALFWGPLDAERGIERCEEIRAQTHELGFALPEAHVCHYLGGLHAMRGQFDEARMLLEEARELFLARGAHHEMSAKALVSGPAEALAGDLEAAEHELRSACEHLESTGETGVYSTLAALLAGILCSQGRPDDAWEFAAASVRTASRDDLASQILAESARGRVLARRGAFVEAEEAARRSVDIAERTDFLNFHGDALMALGEVLDAAGRPDEAREAITRAGALYGQKGNVVAAAAASAALAGTLAG